MVQMLMTVFCGFLGVLLSWRAMKTTWRLISGLLVFWVVILLYMSTSLYQSSDINERTERQLQRAMQELDALKTQNAQLQNLAKELR